MAHHVLRSEKAGSIFKRVHAMINCGQIKFKDRPLWYDAYVLYPPIDEPQWDRKWPNFEKNVRPIFYAEDLHRAEDQRMKQEEEEQKKNLRRGTIVPRTGVAECFIDHPSLPGTRNYFSDRELMSKTQDSEDAFQED